MKSKIYNLIILDESGSMCSYRKATIDGCNETLNVIRASQEEHTETQEHYVSIYVFQSNPRVPSRYLVKNVPVTEVRNLEEGQYEPWGSTPLYDAVGSTLVDLKATTDDDVFAIGNVTIITDGMENASQHYTLDKVSRMISALKEVGWCFNFIGANIDVAGTAKSLQIDNALEFEQTEEGTRAMFAKERQSRMKWARKQACSAALHRDDINAFRQSMKDCNADYFEED